MGFRAFARVMANRLLRRAVVPLVVGTIWPLGFIVAGWSLMQIAQIQPRQGPRVDARTEDTAPPPPPPPIHEELRGRARVFRTVVLPRQLRERTTPPRPVPADAGSSEFPPPEPVE